MQVNLGRQSRSYTIYMVHFPLLLAGVMVSGEGALEGDVALKAGLIGLTLVLADGLTRPVELPAMRLGKAPRELVSA